MMYEYIKDKKTKLINRQLNKFYFLLNYNDDKKACS